MFQRITFDEINCGSCRAELEVEFSSTEFEFVATTDK